MKNARRILNFLEKNKASISPLIILMHNYPDPDAIAGAYALHYLVQKKYGIKSKIVYRGILGRMENRAMVDILDIPIQKYDRTELNDASHVALIDTQPEFENNPFLKKKRATLVIDQHPSTTKPDADLAVIDPACGATCAIVARCLLSLKMTIPSNLATALVYGILTDTSSFLRCNDKAIIRTYLDLIQYADLSLLAKIQNPQRSKSFFATLGKGLQNAVTSDDAIVTHLGAITTPDLSAQVADLLVYYEKVSWAFCTGRYHNKLYLSLRGTTAHPAAYKVLRDIVPEPNMAGGHDVIAGGSFEVAGEGGDQPWEEAEHKLTRDFFMRLGHAESAKIVKDPFELRSRASRKIKK